LEAELAVRLHLEVPLGIQRSGVALELDAEEREEAQEAKRDGYRVLDGRLDI